MVAGSERDVFMSQMADVERWIVCGEQRRSLEREVVLKAEERGRARQQRLGRWADILWLARGLHLSGSINRSGSRALNGR